RRGTGFGGGGDHDAVVGRALGHAGETISQTHLDVIVAQRRQSLLRGLRERAVPLDADHLAREAGENGGLIARARGPFEYTVVFLDAELLGPERAHLGLD